MAISLIMPPHKPLRGSRTRPAPLAPANDARGRLLPRQATQSDVT
ncbi:hypothetical protein SAMN06295900_101449 [Trinickia caryophylli]|uniref:Uncharacterized protein n=1 Tax=Trinickia caryophylli TaxID=28094 RepID=A0A1X7CIW0_TRICW|nr:hypothetical protein SAMN06295900_101449 [Trinickia caryophylli]